MAGDINAQRGDSKERTCVSCFQVVVPPGHINPALALAETLEEQGHEVFYAGTPQGVEARLVKEAGLPFKAFEASGFDRAHPLTLPKALRTIQKSTKRAKEWFAEIKPDVVVAFGGYVCIPVSRAAEALGIPLVIHEQNSVMGMANAYLSKGAARVALTYEVAGEQVADKSKIVVTGNPVRKSILRLYARSRTCLFGHS